jgi:hypothetical protein
MCDSFTDLNQIKCTGSWPLLPPPPQFYPQRTMGTDPHHRVIHLLCVSQYWLVLEFHALHFWARLKLTARHDIHMRPYWPNCTSQFARPCTQPANLYPTVYAYIYTFSDQNSVLYKFLSLSMRATRTAQIRHADLIILIQRRQTMNLLSTRFSPSPPPPPVTFSSRPILPSPPTPSASVLP